MSKPRSIFADYAVYFLVRVFVCVIQTLSLNVAQAFAAGLAWLAYRLLRDTIATPGRLRFTRVPPRFDQRPPIFQFVGREVPISESYGMRINFVGPPSLVEGRQTFTTVSLVLTTLDVAAIVTPLTRADMERATGLARWPRSDADRARFHRPYVVSLTGVGTDFFAIKTVEVITEFRRLELIAEEHARLNDNFARAGLRDAEEAIDPWKGLVWIVARLENASDPKAEGETICVDVIREVREIEGIAGVHIMAPLNHAAIPRVIARARG